MRASSSRPSSNLRLPVGVVRGGTLLRDARARDLEGPDAIRLLDVVFDAPRERVVGDALAVALCRCAGTESADPAFWDGLTFADRHALIRELLIADGVGVVDVPLACPACATALAAPFDLRTVAPVEHDPREPLVAGGVAFRLPTARDAFGADGDEEAFYARICDGAPPAPPVREEIDAELSRLDPLGDVELRAACAACGEPVTTGFDLAATWIVRLRRRAAELLSDIHVLASRYHWTEREILAVPARRRAVYVDLCADGSP
jgi:hypothetical protein